MSFFSSGIPKGYLSCFFFYADSFLKIHIFLVICTDFMLRHSDNSVIKIRWREPNVPIMCLFLVNVDEWINQAQMESLVADEKGLARTPSQVSLRTESSGGVRLVQMFFCLF